MRESPEQRCLRPLAASLAVMLYACFVAIESGKASSISQQQQLMTGVKQVATNNQQPFSNKQIMTQSPSSAPTLMTTLAGQQQQQQQTANQMPEETAQLHSTKTHTHQPYASQDDVAARKRSEPAEDDQTPLATVNNHSNRNNNNNNNHSPNSNSVTAQLRPPQYVDVSALVGRNASISGGSNSYATSNGNSLLSPKSRSGLPECATQQVCNAIFVRMNYTQRLCECSSNYNWKCSNNPDPQDGHTIELTRKFDKRIYTQIKTCEPLREVRACKSPTDWTLLALQSERSGKAHYVVVCKCPTWAQLEGPYTHNHPPYANIPGIRVYGMLCAHQTARSSTAQTYASYNPALNIYPEFPWSEALNVLNTTNLAATLNSH